MNEMVQGNATELTITKDGFEPALESIWTGDGAPDDPVRVKVTLRPYP